MYNCMPLSLPPFSLLMPPPAEAMSCGLINSALMGAQQDGGGVQGVGGGLLEVAGLLHVVFCNGAVPER